MSLKNIALISLTLPLLLTGCFDRTTPVEQAYTDKILHKSNAAEPDDLDPHVIVGKQEWNIILGLFEGLVIPHPKTFEPIPGTASHWEIDPLGTTYTFHLRPEAKWSNGDPLTAHDFVYSAKRVLTQSLAAPYSYFYFNIEGAEDYFKDNSLDFDSTVGIKALDNHTLEMTLKAPLPYFLSLLIHPAFSPVHQPTIEKFHAFGKRGTAWTRAGNMVSNGPFQLKSWSIRTKVAIEKSQHYWNKDIVQLNEVHFYPIDNSSTEERAYRTGQTHNTDAIPLPLVTKYREMPNTPLRLAPFFSTYAYMFNTQKAPFNDKRVRKAFAMALERTEIVENVTKKGEPIALNYTPPGIPGYETDGKIEENIGKAQYLLAQAGYPGGEGFPEVQLLYNTSETHKSIAEALQHMWLKNLNIKVELVNQEWKVYLRQRTEGDFHILRLGWQGDYLDPNAFLELFESGGTNNFARYSNPNYDDLLETGSVTLNKEERFALLNEAENILMDEVPVLPIFFWNTAYLVHPSVKGWENNLLDLHPYQFIRIEEPSS